MYWQLQPAARSIHYTLALALIYEGQIKQYIQTHKGLWQTCLLKVRYQFHHVL